MNRATYRSWKRNQIARTKRYLERLGYVCFPLRDIRLDGRNIDMIATRPNLTLLHNTIGVIIRFSMPTDEERQQILLHYREMFPIMFVIWNGRKQIPTITIE